MTGGEGWTSSDWRLWRKCRGASVGPPIVGICRLHDSSGRRSPRRTVQIVRCKRRQMPPDGDTSSRTRIGIGPSASFMRRNQKTPRCNEHGSSSGLGRASDWRKKEQAAGASARGPPSPFRSRTKPRNRASLRTDRRTPIGRSCPGSSASRHETDGRNCPAIAIPSRSPDSLRSRTPREDAR